MTVIYQDIHADPTALKGRRIAAIGYGSLGRPAALNLRDSGLEVLVGVRSPQTRDMALADGLMVMSIGDVVQRCDILLMMLPDEVMPTFYLEQVSPHLRRNHMLVFSSAYTVTYRFIEPPPFVDVVLVAPRILGQGVRERFLKGEGFPSFVSVGQDASGQAWPPLLAVAGAMGALRGGAIEVTFEQEAELHLFSQQCVLPALYQIFTRAALLLVEGGYPPEAVFTELYLSGELTYYLERVMHNGLLETLNKLPLAGQYGVVSRLARFDELKLERIMETALRDIHGGEFAREWAREYETGSRRLRTFARDQSKLELWELEKQTLEGLERFPDDEAAV